MTYRHIGSIAIEYKAV